MLSNGIRRGHSLHPALTIAPPRFGILTLREMTPSGTSSLTNKKYIPSSGVQQVQALRIQVSLSCWPRPHSTDPSDYGVLLMVHVCAFCLAIVSLFIQLHFLHRVTSFPVVHSLVSFIYGMSVMVRILRASRVTEIYSKLHGTLKRREWQLVSLPTLYQSLISRGHRANCLPRQFPHFVHSGKIYIANSFFNFTLIHINYLSIVHRQHTWTGSR
mmetsp:Transcript_29249/g.49875  ORF Transcript_29249/g.49875 Transcript_29249/m.49875 type:complete len:214 (-) Transcript_29249:1375-2016(-)